MIHTMCVPDIVFMPIHRLRHWTNIKITSGQRPEWPIGIRPTVESQYEREGVRGLLRVVK